MSSRIAPARPGRFALALTVTLAASGPAAAVTNLTRLGASDADLFEECTSKHSSVLSIPPIKLTRSGQIKMALLLGFTEGVFTQGDKIGQVALAFGANDMGSTMIEENVVAAAGVQFKVGRDELVWLIREAGFTAIQRDTLYREVRRFG